ncbi:uncharacterized protein LOC115880258 [Sitophilus oryzae]|uniref:Uncharacterized protein LOC115880258 n=1 Tax=Sitophilus oryzae TaxID=7048 RepID=A0A6J2XP62_SITOR|nr:uncharacterized protein LOC115880258 [Sitophilus oryzae]
MKFYILILNIFACFLSTNSEISVLDSGTAPIEEDDIVMVFFATVKNICQDDLELSVSMAQCCETMSSGETDCSSMTLIGGDMGTLSSGYTKNLTLLYPNIYLYNRRGVCTVLITYRNQFKKKEITTDISFDTRKDCASTHKETCFTFDLDYKQNCNPVDCLIKYSGGASYFSSDYNLCQKVPMCISKSNGEFPEKAYSPYSNECIDLNNSISKNDLEEIGTTRSLLGNQMTIVNAICHYGSVTENGDCVCRDGWTTDTSDEGMYEPNVSQRHLCNIEQGDWNSVNKKRVRITTILIAIFAITIISKVLLLMCVMTWCYKHFKAPEKMCGRQLDPDDKNLVLCEDIETFSKCACCNTEENIEAEPTPSNKPSRKLHSQTVNVSYYSCSPSAFSSNKSTASSRISCNTDQSIELNNTTSSASISFPQGEESEESEEICFGGDGNSEDIAYGVYCSMDEVSGEEIEIESGEEENENEEVKRE